MDIKEILSKRLKSILEEKNMNQNELAKKSLVTEATISNFLNCKQLPKLEVISKIASVLDVSVDYLLGKSDLKNIKYQIAAHTKDNIDISDLPESDKLLIKNIIKQFENRK